MDKSESAYVGVKVAVWERVLLWKESGEASEVQQQPELFNLPSIYQSFQVPVVAYVPTY